jgi:hypothetical protein
MRLYRDEEGSKASVTHRAASKIRNVRLAEIDPARVGLRVGEEIANGALN